MFALSYVNLLSLLKDIPTPTSAATGFPVTNLLDGWQWRPHVFAAAGDNSINFSMVAHLLDFEAAFVSSLPVEAAGLNPTWIPGTWQKTAGATATRNTATPQAGAGCLEVNGSSTDYVAFDFAWPAGAQIGWYGGLRLKSGAVGFAKVQLWDLDARKQLVVTAPGSYDWVEGTGQLASSIDAAAWETTVGHARLLAPDVVGRVWSRLQLRFYAPVFGGALYDEWPLYPGLDFLAVLGHNVPPSGGDGTLGSGGFRWSQYGANPGTVVARAPAVAPTTFDLVTYLASGPDVYGRLLVPRPPLEEALWIGELWGGALHQLESAEQEFTYPLRARHHIPQARAGGGGAETQASRRGDLEMRRLDLSMSSPQTYEALRTAFRLAHYGAERVLLIAPVAGTDRAMLGRLLGPDGIEGEELSGGTVRGSITFEEEPHARLAP